jgi:hypothetical protein
MYKPKLWKSDETVKIDPSPCTPSTVYRYSLQVTWKEGPIVVVIGLNPSIADDQKDDKTIRQCIDWARANGYSGLLMLNAYAVREMSPEKMMAADDPFGTQTPEKLVELCGSNFVVAAWGTNAKCRGRGAAVAAAFERAGAQLQCWGINKTDDSPKHPGRIGISKTEPWPRKPKTTS